MTPSEARDILGGITDGDMTEASRVAADVLEDVMRGGITNLSESYRTTIMHALAHENTSAAVHVLRELERQGWKLPAWVRSDLERYGHVAVWRTDERNDL